MVWKLLKTNLAEIVIVSEIPIARAFKLTSTELGCYSSQKMDPMLLYYR